MGFLDQIPFINSDNYGTAGLMSVSGDMCVQGGHTLSRINNQNGYVTSFQVAARHDHAEFLSFELGLPFSPDSGSVNKSDCEVTALNQAVDRVSSSPGHRRNHRPLLADKPVQECGLTHIWPADNGYANLTFPILFIFFRRWH